jgi:hypothetical protein
VGRDLLERRELGITRLLQEAVVHKVGLRVRAGSRYTSLSATVRRARTSRVKRHFTGEVIYTGSRKKGP